MGTEKNHDATVRRAALPEVMFASDLAFVLCLSEEEAESAARRGRFGPQFFVQGRVAVLRQDFLEFLTRRASARTAEGKELLQTPTPPPSLRCLPRESQSPTRTRPGTGDSDAGDHGAGTEK